MVMRALIFPLVFLVTTQFVAAWPLQVRRGAPTIIAQQTLTWWKFPNEPRFAFLFIGRDLVGAWDLQERYWYPWHGSRYGQPEDCAPIPAPLWQAEDTR
jgi:hypothetical protein